MRLDDTIVALASPPGFAPRALIRLSGPAAAGTIAALSGAGAPRERGLSSIRVSIGDGATLPALLAFFPGPGSFTGEDVAEVLLPSNPHLVARVIGAMLGCPGVRAAEGGEFSARAYLNGRLTIAQAEGAAATIAARTREEHEAAGRLLGGESGREASAAMDEAARLLALVEAGIDFIDQEDVRAIEPADLRRGLDALAARLGAWGGAVSAEAHLPRVVLAGAPNAGKSSLFNALLGRERAIASPHAGTTRDPLREMMEAAGALVEIVDLPGLGDDVGAVGTPEQEARRLALAALGEADVVVHCDPSGRFEPIPGAHAARVLRVRTMADLCVGAQAGDLSVCAIDGRGIEDLRRAIGESAVGSRSSGEAGVIPRHAGAIRRARSRLLEARAASLVQADPAIVAGLLRGAVDALGEVTGRIDPDEVLGRIFATFCVGK